MSKIKELFENCVRSRGLRNQSESESDWAEFGRAIYMEYLDEYYKKERELNKKDDDRMVISCLVKYYMPKKNFEKLKNNVNPEIFERFFN